ncbi:phosphomethylpyrimidine kinase [Geothermobacter hydrogeniphilus]|uniref:Thiamine-phosphate synthase n=1 Tax=Geothermobacter hydrogeniphilus TaxID=1969733 RepID=A0A2K2HBE6_9BACT|nr:bifunctional hydroxymethylpyrimidine kinase/phosphomethylpyrimidine kinase [Geothermobacter hydrogeniphilus]PNU20591.1 phosphomethylpyrimidine kinase [Geothermobacter hydrogeniphilus]
MINGLYYITDADPEGRYLETTRAVLQGGARVIQYRSKARSIGDQREDARGLLELCREFGAKLLINDNPELATDVEADGVHLGQNDAPVSAARQLLGPGRLIGVSTRTVEQALQAETDGADYIAVGSIYPTTTKQDAVQVGLRTLEKVRRAVKLPLVAIGGIRRDLAPAVLEAGADGLAVISALREDSDPRIAAREFSLLFNRGLQPPRGRVLTVAGSDSGGGAGIQADLKTITLLGGYGMSAVTALTAQNTLGVTGIHPCPADFVAEQLETVLSDLGCDILKTGMLFSADIVSAVASAIDRHGLPAVVDPVMIAKGGAPLLQQQAVEVLITELLPFTYLLTPNLPEAEALSGIAIETETEMERAARKLQTMGARNVLLKGGHLKGAAVDLLLAGDKLHRFASERIATTNTHGTGCSYSSAIATLLAQGQPLPVAVKTAKRFINAAIATAPDLGNGHGPVNHWQGAKAIMAHTRNENH